ncbi:MAG: WecB/TagA/CpsF family glycosyltransferase [Candidatus Brocadiae bacterium]|nr:WecB/TagA/CpsF family glycosyltransferase [Candidatus Brocadiia bacterium]
MQPTDSTMPFVEILGSRVHLLSIQEIVDKIREWIEQKSGKCHQIVVTGFHGLWEAHKKPELKKIFNSASLWIPDGIAPVWIARHYGLKAERTPGADVMNAFLSLANEKKYKSFFYGDTDDTLHKLKEALAKKYPNHIVVGTYSPPFRPLSQQEDQQIMDMIAAADPDVLWVGLGTPKQDRWIYEHLPKLKVPVAIAVGAAFQFLAGKVKRAPSWVGSMGLEWLWRLALEPKKLWRRDIIDGPMFIFSVLKEIFSQKKAKS